jgi:hypothetical protein
MAKSSLFCFNFCQCVLISFQTTTSRSKAELGRCSRKEKHNDKYRKENHDGNCYGKQESLEIPKSAHQPIILDFFDVLQNNKFLSFAKVIDIDISDVQCHPSENSIEVDANVNSCTSTSSSPSSK